MVVEDAGMLAFQRHKYLSLLALLLIAAVSPGFAKDNALAVINASFAQGGAAVHAIPHRQIKQERRPLHQGELVPPL